MSLGKIIGIILVTILFVFIISWMYSDMKEGTHKLVDGLAKDSACETYENKCDEIRCKLNQREIYATEYLADLLIVNEKMCVKHWKESKNWIKKEYYGD